MPFYFGLRKNVKCLYRFVNEINLNNNHHFPLKVSTVIIVVHFGIQYVFWIFYFGSLSWDLFFVKCSDYFLHYVVFYILVIDFSADFSIVSNCNDCCFLLKHISLIICIPLLINKFGFCKDWLGSLGSNFLLWTELQPMHWCLMLIVFALLIQCTKLLIGLNLSCELRSFIGIYISLYFGVFMQVFSFHYEVLSFWHKIGIFCYFVVGRDESSILVWVFCAKMLLIIKHCF